MSGHEEDDIIYAFTKFERLKNKCTDKVCLKYIIIHCLFKLFFFFCKKNPLILPNLLILLVRLNDIN